MKRTRKKTFFSSRFPFFPSFDTSGDARGEGASAEEKVLKVGAFAKGPTAPRRRRLSRRLRRLRRRRSRVSCYEEARLRGVEAGEGRGGEGLSCFRGAGEERGLGHTKVREKKGGEGELETAAHRKAYCHRRLHLTPPSIPRLRAYIANSAALPPRYPQPFSPLCCLVTRRPLPPSPGMLLCRRTSYIHNVPFMHTPFLP